jgi:hypothetical protein
MECIEETLVSFGYYVLVRMQIEWRVHVTMPILYDSFHFEVGLQNSFKARQVHIAGDRQLIRVWRARQGQCDCRDARVAPGWSGSHRQADRYWCVCVCRGRIAKLR